MVRVAVAVLAGAAGAAAAAASGPERYRAFSDAATVVMLTLIVMLLLTGVFQPAAPQTSELLQGRARARANGRRLRAVVAASGVVWFSVAIVTDSGDSSTSWSLFIVLSSLVAPLVTYVWWRASASPGEVHAQQLMKAKTSAGRRWQAQEARDIATTPRPRYENLVASSPPTGGPTTVRPRPQLPGHGRLPWGSTKWLRHAEIAADASSVAVTDATGRTRTLPRAVAPGGFGVALLAICREDVRYRTQYGWSAPQRVEALALLTPDRQRLLDLDLYGWTRADLCAFAAASGLGLERFWYDRPNLAVPRLTGLPPTPLQRWLPRSAHYDRARGRERWPRVLGITAAVIGTVAALGAIGLLGVATHVATGGSMPWLGPVVTTGAFVVLVATLPGLARRADERRRGRSAYLDAV
ncbi:MAG: hypothetical protein HOV68_25850 [Streptomycetaceae bacterium]|nr:hypothetical protein [Streptomycetaceae bacterium]